MHKLLLATVAVLSVSPVFAQVKAPDYKDASVWKYYECYSPTSNIKDSDDLAYHEDYLPAMADINVLPLSLAAVVYKPVNRSVLIEGGVEKFIEASKKQPWLLIHFTTYSAEKLAGNLFEYVDGAWKFVKEFGSGSELSTTLSEEYKILSQ